MKHWNDLHPLSQGDYNKGRIGSVGGSSWPCYWKWISREKGVIEVYSEFTQWTKTTTDYKNLSNAFDWK